MTTMRALGYHLHNLAHHFQLDQEVRPPEYETSIQTHQHTQQPSQHDHNQSLTPNTQHSMDQSILLHEHSTTNQQYISTSASQMSTDACAIGQDASLTQQPCSYWPLHNEQIDTSTNCFYAPSAVTATSPPTHNDTSQQYYFNHQHEQHNQHVLLQSNTQYWSAETKYAPPSQNSNVHHHHYQHFCPQRADKFQLTDNHQQHQHQHQQSSCCSSYEQRLPQQSGIQLRQIYAATSLHHQQQHESEVSFSRYQELHNNCAPHQVTRHTELAYMSHHHHQAQPYGHHSDSNILHRALALQETNIDHAATLTIGEARSHQCRLSIPDQGRAVCESSSVHQTTTTTVDPSLRPNVEVDALSQAQATTHGPGCSDTKSMYAATWTHVASEDANGSFASANQLQRPHTAPSPRPNLVQTKRAPSAASSKLNASNEFKQTHSKPPSECGAVRAKTNQCNVCGRNYARPSTLKTHLRTHTNERPFKCAVCFKTFSQAANLTAHQRVHTGERPFSCSVCGRQFSQSSSVITHLRTHSGERPYRCGMCNRTFSDSSTLTKHCRIHSGEKPYQCDFCPLNFSQSGNLSRHLRLHQIANSRTNPPSTTTSAAVSTEFAISSLTSSMSSSTSSSSSSSSLSSTSFNSVSTTGACNRMTIVQTENSPTVLMNSNDLRRSAVKVDNDNNQN